MEFLKLVFASLVMSLMEIECVKWEKVELAIHEGSADFKEQIFADSSGRYGIIKVPQHNNMSEVQIFIDYQKGYRIEKIVSEKICMVMELNKSKDKPMDLINGVKHAHNKFPTSMYMVVHESILTTGKVDLESPMGKMAALFCGTGMDIQHAVSYVGENLNEFATQLFRTDAKKNLNRRKKRAVELRKDYRCCLPGCNEKKGQQKHAEMLTECNGDVGKVKASCRATTHPKGCVYRVSCPLSGPVNARIYTCDSPNHIFNSVVCCDFSCNKD